MLCRAVAFSPVCLRTRGAKLPMNCPLTINHAPLLTKMWHNITDVHLDLFHLRNHNLDAHVEAMRQITPTISPVSVTIRNDSWGVWSASILSFLCFKRCTFFELFWVNVTDAVLQACERAEPTTLKIEPILQQYLTSNARELVQTCGRSVTTLQLRRASQPIIEAALSSCPKLQHLIVDEAAPGVHLQGLLQANLQTCRLSRHRTFYSSPFFDEFDGVVYTQSTTLRHLDLGEQTDLLLKPMVDPAIGLTVLSGLTNLVSLRLSGIVTWDSQFLIVIAASMPKLEALWYTPITRSDACCQMTVEAATALGVMPRLYGMVLPCSVLRSNGAASRLAGNVKVLAADGHKGPYNQSLVFTGTYTHGSKLWDAMYAGKNIARPLRFPRQFIYPRVN